MSLRYSTYAPAGSAYAFAMFAAARTGVQKCLQLSRKCMEPVIEHIESVISTLAGDANL